MERIVQGRSATLTKTFTFTPTGTPTVALTRLSDGTTVATGGVTGAGTTWSYTIPASSNTLLDTYVETWTAVSGGAAQTFVDYVEVAGGALFSLPEARALTPLNNTTAYTDAAILDMRTLVEQALESPLGYALVPRYMRATFTPDGSDLLRAPVVLVGEVPGTGIPLATTVRDVKVDGVAVTTTDVIPDTVGFYYTAGWGTVRRSVTIGFEHGALYPPGRVSEAALREARYRLVQKNSPTDDRATIFSNDQGTYALVTPGGRGNGFWLPETNEVVSQYSLRAGVA